MKQQLRRTSEMKNINGAFKNPSLRGTKQSFLFITFLRGMKQSNQSLTNQFRLLHSAKADVRKDGD